MGGKNNLELQNNRAFLRLKKSLTLSNLWIYILSTAKKQKFYAYSLDKEIEKKFLFKPSKLWIYLVLYRLENDGLLISKQENNRKYYIITKKGSQLLKQGKEFIKKIHDLL